MVMKRGVQCLRKKHKNYVDTDKVIRETCSRINRLRLHLKDNKVAFKKSLAFKLLEQSVNDLFNDWEKIKDE